MANHTKLKIWHIRNAVSSNLTQRTKMKKSTQYIIDANGKHWLPPHTSMAMGMARYAWFKRLMGVEAPTASKDYWEELTYKYPIMTAEDKDEQ